MREIAAAILSILDRGERGALATVIAVSGSTPQVPGAKLVATCDGGLVGTVGGGRIEQVVIEALRQTIDDGKTRRVRKHLGRDLGMCCGGSMEVFVEPIEARPTLLLFGAGHVAQPTASFAHALGFEVTVVDARPEQNDEARFPDARRVLMEPREAVAGQTLPFGPEAYVVVTTHDHRLDEEALRACLDQPRRYLGMIGSQRKVLRIFSRLRQRDPELDLSAVHAPIGLDLGAHTPNEIAVAIVAELVACRRGGRGGSLKDALAPLPDAEAPAAASGEASFAGRTDRT